MYRRFCVHSIPQSNPSSDNTNKILEVLSLYTQLFSGCTVWLSKASYHAIQRVYMGRLRSVKGLGFCLEDKKDMGVVTYMLHQKHWYFLCRVQFKYTHTYPHNEVTCRLYLCYLQRLGNSAQMLSQMGFSLN